MQYSTWDGGEHLRYLGSGHVLAFPAESVAHAIRPAYGNVEV